MRFMMIVKASAAHEAGAMPSEELLSAMGKYNEELKKAGVLVEVAGLQPTSKGARIRYSGGRQTVVDGPFTETKEIVGGYWIIQADSWEKALEWARRAPAPHSGGEGEIELRPIFDLNDFAPSDAVDRARELGKELEKKSR